MQRELYVSVFVIGIFLILCGCAHKKPLPASIMDSPEHHYHTGCTLMDQERFSDALGEFRKSEQLDPQYAPAQVGIGLALSEMGAFDDALAAFRKARKLADSDADRVLYHTGMIRFYTKQQGRGWLHSAENHFNDGRSIDADDPGLHFSIACAYRVAGEYQKASGYYEKVISFGRGYIAQSNDRWEEIQKIERSIPGTRVGKQIAGLQSITRADAAALIIEELNLGDLFLVDSPEESESVPAGELSDYEDHVLKKDIVAITSMGIRGLEPVGGRFYPNEKVKRADFAVMVEDILVKIKREDTLPTLLIGSSSPFKDVDKSNYAYNAILVCTTRGILEAGIDGRFNPDQGVSGSEALLALRKLKGIIISGKGMGFK